MQDIKIFAKTIDQRAISQIYTLASQAPFIGEKIRIMPDAHAGIGAVVGFTATLSDKIIPNVIGVDIGCGMRTVSLGKIDISLPMLDSFIRKNIPAGSEVRATYSGEEMINSLLCRPSLREISRLFGSLGTLGGGNHFIEIDEGEGGEKYLVIHTGSRNLGTQVAKIYQKIAERDCKTVSREAREKTIASLREAGRVAEIPAALENLTKEYAHKTKIPSELCYLEGEAMLSYLHDMKICQDFARRNREEIARLILTKFLRLSRCDAFETVHNFIGDDNIIRKGAVPAYPGERLLIPMNMRDGCLICEGLGNADWNYSSPHGAGRLMSRSEAKGLLTLEEYKKEMTGIYTTSADMSTIDESPMAYKPTDEIIEAIFPTVRIISRIKPIYNFKASE